MLKKAVILILFSVVFLSASGVMAQVVVVNSDEVRSWLDGKKKVFVIDVRSNEEYLQGHIPGAVNITPENMTAARDLPKVKTTALIFYCRGMN